ncbi:MAG: proline racemase family protein [Rhizobiaceae bacterium]
MQWSKTLHMTEVHAEGEVGRVVTGGMPVIPGKTLIEKFRHLNSSEDTLRRGLVLEPRSSPAGSTNLLFPPENPDNHAGFIVLQPDQAHAMSGSNAICVTTALLETGIVEMQEGENLVKLETAAGLVVAKANCSVGKCNHVTLTMPASFVEYLDYELETQEWGTIKADISYGGVFYAILDASELGLEIKPAAARELSDAGMKLRQLFNDAVNVIHPQNPDISGIAYVMFRGCDKDGAVRTATTMWPGRLDRSPCGTGNSAYLAVRAARGEVTEGDEYISRSTISSLFKVRFSATSNVGDKTAVIPEITGRGWIYGMHQIGFDPTDPFRDGFAMTDTWGLDAGKI